MIWSKNLLHFSLIKANRNAENVNNKHNYMKSFRFQVEHNYKFDTLMFEIYNGISIVNNYNSIFIDKDTFVDLIYCFWHIEFSEKEMIL